jgi:hypothetical protein
MDKKTRKINMTVGNETFEYEPTTMELPITVKATFNKLELSQEQEDMLHDLSVFYYLKGRNDENGGRNSEENERCIKAIESLQEALFRDDYFVAGAQE